MAAPFVITASDTTVDTRWIASMAGMIEASTFGVNICAEWALMPLDTAVSYDFKQGVGELSRVIVTYFEDCSAGNKEKEF